MAFDVVYSGRFLRNGRFENIEVGVDGGIIVKTGKNLDFRKKIRLDGAVIPAGTDTHVHFRDPWETEKEDFATGSLSALYGGTTTVFDMPNNRIPIADYEVYETKLAAVRKKSFVDFGLYSMFTGSNAEILHRDSSAVKIFLGGSTNSVTTDSFAGPQVGSVNTLGIPAVFHAESGACLDSHKGIVKDLKTHNLARPEICEQEAVSIALNSGFERKVITHATLPSTLSEASGKSLTEVTPHHLLLNEDFESTPYRKMNPPLRSRETQESLMNLFLTGRVDVLSSDHAPHTEAEKDDFQFASSGVIGVETRLPLMLSLVAKNILDLNVLVKVACYNPARNMGTRKGKIAPGFLADFIAVRFSDRKRLRDRYLHSKNPQTPFDGFEVVFPHSVVLRGNLVLSDSEAYDDRSGYYVHDIDGVGPAEE